MATTKKSVAKKATKVVPKKVTKPTKKETPNKAVKVAKPAAKKPVATKSTFNKALESMLAKIEKAKKAKETKVVVYTTKKSDHKENPNGLTTDDLKPKLFEAYHYLSCKYGVKFKHDLVSIEEGAIEWIVNF